MQEQTSMFDDVVWDWRRAFSPETLRLAESDERKNNLLGFEVAPNGKSATALTIRGFRVHIMNVPTTLDELDSYPDFGDPARIYALQGIDSEDYFYCSCSQAQQGVRCRHMANLLLHWEAEKGGAFSIKVSQAERTQAVQRKAQQALKKAKMALKLPAEEILKKFITPMPAEIYFRMDDALHHVNPEANQWIAEEVAHLWGQNPGDPEVGFGFIRASGEQAIEANQTIDSHHVHTVLSKEMLVVLTCDCGKTNITENTYWYYTRKPSVCAHALTGWLALRRAVIRDNPGDHTDSRAEHLLSLLVNSTLEEDASEQTEAASQDVKRPDIRLIPRVVHQKDNRQRMKLSFDLSVSGAKALAVKGLEGLVKAVDEEQEYSLSKTLSVDFSKQTFTEDSWPWYRLISSRVHTVQSLNNAAMDNWRYNSRTLSAGSGIPLEAGDLDTIYEIAQGGTLLNQVGSRNECYTISVGEAHPRVEITLTRTKGKSKAYTLTGQMPNLLQGTQYQYLLNDTTFGRVEGNAMRLLQPFHRIADSQGIFRCVIGERKFADFAYRVLPALRQAPEIELVDTTGVTAELESMLPPEPEFIFYLDVETPAGARGEVITCMPEVRYPEHTFPLASDAPRPQGIRWDRDQEERALGRVQEYFPDHREGTSLLSVKATEAQWIRVLTEGLTSLSRFGEVRGSDAFQRVRLRPAPTPTVGVRLESDLLNLSIQTTDLNQRDLLALLNSYRQKKRWHRLRSGEFVDLRNPEGLQALDDALQALDIPLEDLLKKDVQIPKYRALYVDRLLEAHEDLASSRNRTFNSLIRSFQTIRDADFEPSADMQQVLRPYQLYGFRWLSTLSHAGFGGILADEMGLGKTLQMLAWLQKQREEGESLPALVVCPASLVYNWKEECRKFTPDLRVETLAGTQAARKAQIQEIRTGTATALYITSYDLLKRDIALYDGLRFSTVILDEAQFIKNQKAAVSKSVRVLQANHRFALTGTPIENRLSELWSIFDFLMPGFLYSAQEFGTRFETPIMKQKDAAATTRLARMTEPFILRRKKMDVLKDLPEKLEETRSAGMDTEQRRLYDAQVLHMKEVLASSGDSGEDKMRILAEITRLRQLCCDPSLLFDNYHGASAKREACLELIESAMDGGHRMLVFSQFTSMLELLSADLKQAGIPFYTLTGATPKQERLRLVNAFNEGDTPVFLISLKAGGTGLNLTGADVVIHYDPWWNLAVQNQATDRAHRIGQTRQVTVIRLIAADTIEEKIVELQEKKRDLAEAIITGENTSLMSLSREELLELLA